MRVEAVAGVSVCCFAGLRHGNFAVVGNTRLAYALDAPPLNSALIWRWRPACLIKQLIVAASDVFCNVARRV